MEKPIIAISMGDPAGIGPEIIVKALEHKELYEICTPLVVGDKDVIEDALRITNSHLKIRSVEHPEKVQGDYGFIDLMNLNLIHYNEWEYGCISELAGKASFAYVKKMIELAMNEEVQATVTGPITKASINLAGYHYAGHTEIYADLTSTEDYGMLLISQNLRVIHVTTHCALREACNRIKRDRVLSTIKLANTAMISIGITAPRIAVAGLNPHSSENGLFGSEEKDEIIPAINAAKDTGINVDGPIPPDTVFVKAVGGLYDIVVAMYHDQGHIPLKLNGFRLDVKTGEFSSMNGINVTVGLPIIRTSVDHGTAYDKAGKGIANEGSMLDAIELAVKMANRKFNFE